MALGGAHAIAIPGCHEHGTAGAVQRKPTHVQDERVASALPFGSSKRDHVGDEAGTTAEVLEPIDAVFPIDRTAPSKRRSFRRVAAGVRFGSDSSPPRAGESGVKN